MVRIHFSLFKFGLKLLPCKRLYPAYFTKMTFRFIVGRKMLIVVFYFNNLPGSFEILNGIIFTFIFDIATLNKFICH